MIQPEVLVYRVVYYQTGHFDYVSLNTTTTSFTLHSLAKGTSYSVVVYAINIAGTSVPSNVVTARTDIDRE